MATLRSGDRVLDIACGTGIVARTAAKRLGDNGSMVGLDVSGPMLATARTAPEGAAVEWQEGSAVKLNTVHLTIWMAAVKSIRMVGCAARGRSG
jgi:ubiquinone/menaquinone biosynthesis C-methylase UbiE